MTPQIPVSIVLQILYTIRGNIFESLDHETAIRTVGYVDRWTEALQESCAGPAPGDD
jgi:hypothetical protein